MVLGCFDSLEMYRAVVGNEFTQVGALIDVGLNAIHIISDVLAHLPDIGVSKTSHADAISRLRRQGESTGEVVR
jgi:hypothetical protein